MPDAQITLTNADNGRTYKMKADKNGQFSAIGIPAGVYNEEVAAGQKRFKAQVRVRPKLGPKTTCQWK